MNKMVLSPKETAEKLGIGMNKVYDLLRQKIIPSKRIGRKILIPVEALENWLLMTGGELA